jgi:hypothetical protein
MDSKFEFNSLPTYFTILRLHLLSFYGTFKFITKSDHTPLDRPTFGINNIKDWGYWDFYIYYFENISMQKH